MNAVVQIDTSAFDALIERLDTGADPSRDGPMRDGLLESSNVYLQSMRDRFASASAGDGTWAEHAPSTVARRGEGAPILNETGKLEDSMLRDGPDHVLNADGEGVTEGTANRIARYHQDGTSGPSERTMPARRILVDPALATIEAMTDPIVTAIHKLASGQ